MHDISTVHYLYDFRLVEVEEFASGSACLYTDILPDSATKNRLNIRFRLSSGMPGSVRRIYIAFFQPIPDDK